MGDNAKELPVIKSILLGIPDMITVLAEMAENQKTINAFLVQGEDNKTQIKGIISLFDTVREELSDIDKMLKDGDWANVKGSGIRKFVDFTSDISSVIDYLDVAKKRLNTLFVLYNDLTRSMHSSNQISYDLDNDATNSDGTKLAYEMSLDELEGVVEYFGEICKNVSIISYEINSNTDNWLFYSSKAKTWLVPRDKKNEWIAIKSKVKDVHSHSMELVKKCGSLSDNTTENVNQWRELLNLYHI